MDMPAKITFENNPSNALDPEILNSEERTPSDETKLAELQKLTGRLQLSGPDDKIKGSLHMLSTKSEETISIVETSMNKVRNVASTSSAQSLRASTESFSMLESIRSRAVPTPVSSEASITEPGTGHLHNLTAFQRERLFQLWGILLEYFKLPFDHCPSKKISKAFASSLLEETRNRAHSLPDVSFTEEESNAFDANPITDELFFQFSTDDPDKILLRFLRARKWVVIDAFNMLTDALKWRSSTGLRELMLEGERRIKSSLLEGGKNFFWKRDKENHLMCYVRSRLHDKNAQTLQESIDFTIYSVEWGRRLRDHDDQLVSILFDLKDAPFASLDLSILQFMVNALQSFYPEILGRCLIKDAPWIFSGFWKLVRPLLDPEVARKIVFVKQEELVQYIPKEDLPIEYGGDDPYVFRYFQPDPTSDFPRNPDEKVSSELLARLQLLRARFVETTREIHTLISRIEEPRDLERIIFLVKERRDDIKKEICDLYRQLDCHVLPRTYYHRVGILDETNRVHWDEYRLPAAPEVRMSAPPILTSHVKL